MDFEKAAALATLGVELMSERQARIVRKSTISNPCLMSVHGLESMVSAGE
ncbi:hypothetical protein [Bradyrhizobium sp. USDA 336]